jgi:translation elongation factor EF-Tu-like GTPase
MRKIPFALIAAAALVAVAGCSSDEPGSSSGNGGVEEGAPPAGSEQTFEAGRQITVELTMAESGDGGRITSFFSGYRPTVEFEYEEQSTTCYAQLPVDLREFPPGETHRIGLECDDAVAAHPDTPGFQLVESGKTVGTGVIVFTG